MVRPRPEDPPNRGWAGALPVAILLVAATLAVLGQVAGFEFITFDDEVYVTDNAMVRAGLTGSGLRWAFGFHASNWHPLTWLSLMLDAEMGGLDPAVFHVTNLLLHLGATLALFLFLARATRRTWPSGLVALLFAIHPLHVESVAWVAERKDVLSAFLGFLTLLAYAGYAAKPGALRYAWLLLVFALGLMAKPMLVTLPVILLLLDVWPLARGPSPRLIVEKLPLLVLAAASSVVTIAAQQAGGAMTDLRALPIADRLGNATVACGTYLLQTIWPADLSFFYPHAGRPSPLALFLAAACLAGISVLAWRQRRLRPWLSVGWAWYLVTLLPVIGIIQVGLQSHADRYTYIPLVGVFVVIVWAVAELLQRLGPRSPGGRIAGAIGLLLLLALGLAAHAQAGYWRDSATLYRRALEIDENNPVARANLGLVLLRAGQAVEAERHAREAMRIDPDYREPLVTLANALARQGRIDEALATYRAALVHEPDNAMLHSNLGTVLADGGRLAEAARHFREALRLEPDSVDAHNNVGVLMARLGRWDEAIEAFTAALRLSPYDGDVRANLEQARKMKTRAAAP